MTTTDRQKCRARFQCVLAIAVLAFCRIPAIADSPCRAERDRLAAAKSAADQQYAKVELAQCLLVREAAAPLTAELNEDESQRPRLRSIAGEALGLLEGIDGATTNDALLGDRAALLRAFAATFRAIAGADGSDEANDALKNACVELSLYMDETDRNIAESAKLWQAVAYRRAGHPDRALRLLEPILGEGSGSAVDFYSRLERCRSLTARGSCIAAISLAIKIEDKIETWMQSESKPTRDAAQRTVRTMRVAILNTWAEELRRLGFDERAVNAESTAKSLQQSAAGDVLTLTETIVELGPLAKPQASTSSQPSETEEASGSR